MTTLLVDGDEYLYKACAAVERETRWDDQNHILSSNAEEAWDVFTGSLKKLEEKLEAERLFLAFSGTGNFRRDLLDTYKGGRSRKPLCYWRLYERAHEEFVAKHVDGLEADDLLGIWATSKFPKGVIVSADKDMQTLPATLFREGEVLTRTEHQANEFWLTQTLTGDPTDGYSGCPGIGKVKAEKLLKEFWVNQVEPEQPPVFMLDAAWEAVVRTFEAAGLTYEDALLQARLARILRASDWDTERREVILWQP